MCIILVTGPSGSGKDSLLRIPLLGALLRRGQVKALLLGQVLDGVVEAVNQSTVSAQTAGRVETIMVDVNDYVPQGAPIIRIRNIEQGLKAMFIDIGLDKNAFLHFWDAIPEALDASLVKTVVPQGMPQRD